jgi:hypothetical protein
VRLLWSENSFKGWYNVRGQVTGKPGFVCTEQENLYPGEELKTKHKARENTKKIIMKSSSIS